MKKLSFVSVLFIGLVIMSLSVKAIGTRDAFTKFEISVVENQKLDGEVQKAWQITYGENETPVTVEKVNNSKGCSYLVRSDYFEVCYNSTAKGFGAKSIKNSQRKVPFDITNAVINGESLKQQSVITPNSVDDEKALGLIASYLPMLINDNYTHLLN